ncbi:hypothetical protein S245_036293 [Arachis hypogaea]
MMQFLHLLISSLCSIAPIGLQNVFSLELTSTLLAKDNHNVFGLMQLVSVDDGQRFDYVDSNLPDGSNNTDIIVRMIHDVLQGREIYLSYFFVNENYASR